MEIVNFDISNEEPTPVDANLLEKEPLMPYEARYLWEKIEDADFQLSIGVSRLARRLSKDKSNVYRFGASFAGSQMGLITFPSMADFFHVTVHIHKDTSEGFVA